MAGVLVDAERDLLLTTDRGCARLSICRASDEKTTRSGPRRRAAERCRVRFPAEPRVHVRSRRPARRRMHVHDRRYRNAHRHRPRCPSRTARWALYDPVSLAVYANISDPPCIVVIETNERKIGRVIDVRLPDRMVSHSSTTRCLRDRRRRADRRRPRRPPSRTAEARSPRPTS